METTNKQALDLSDNSPLNTNEIEGFNARFMLYVQQHSQRKWLFSVALVWVAILTGAFLCFVWRVQDLVAANPGKTIDWHFFLIGFSLIAPAAAVLWFMIKRVFEGDTRAQGKPEDKGGLLWADVVKEAVGVLRDIFKKS